MKLSIEQLKLASNTVRCLCADMIDQANSGHPGAPLGMADLAVSLWLNHLNVAPQDVKWPCRDRLVFSGGHASALVYALFHLAGVAGLTMDELKAFRQYGSRCAGHPERGLLPGVEVTTGPLGQGIAMGVGLALGAKKAKTGNKTWVFCGDGDLEEGISHEACSWAGAMKLDDLVLVYDSNRITIEGDTALAMADDTKKRFESYGWKVYTCDGHDFEAIDRTYRRALRTPGQPVLIIAATHIGFGAPTKQDSAESHGAPLGAEETKGLKRALGFDPERSFVVPDEVYALFAARATRLNRQAKRSRRERPDIVCETKAPDYMKLVGALPKFEPGASVATRSACGEVMNALAPVVPELTGGSADLGPSNKTVLKGLGDVAPGAFEGRNLHYGIRELAMAAIVNGLTAFGGWRGYGATFFVFSDYCKPAIRLAALMKLPSIFVFSHDSFYVGEDGPTHEPVEQLAALRATPGLTTFRPADANETAYAWAEMLLNTTGPSCLLTTRQNLPVLPGVRHEGVAKGGYVIYEQGPQSMETVLFVASGSEVSLCIAAAKKLAEEGKSVRVASIPSYELFLRQPNAYRETVLPELMKKRVFVEAGVRYGWDRFRMDFRTTRFVTMDRFGASAPYKTLAEKFGYTVENVLKVAREIA
ncbi:MAG: transketolase [Kiritimatiellae bacterium]|nr:transketolase [Kiritimatiellia bacterium]